MISKRNVCVAMVLTGLLGLNSAWAEMPGYGKNCKIPNQVEDFSLYTLENAMARNSDVHGSIGSGGSVDLDQYKIAAKDKNCLVLSSQSHLFLSNLEILQTNDVNKQRGIEAGGNINLASASVWGSVLSLKTLNLRSLNIEGNAFASRINSEYASARDKNEFTDEPELSVKHETIKEKFINQSNVMLAYTKNADVVVKENSILIQATQETSVVFIDWANFSKKTIVINASKVKKLIINLTAKNIKMHETNIVLNGISAQSIYWNMPQAETLDIFKTVNSKYGIPGRIYAPLARTSFYLGRITGGLYIKSLEYNDSSMNLPTGQINNFDPSISGFLN